VIKHKFSDLKVGDEIKLGGEETFIIDKIFEGNYVDMTSTKPYYPEIGMNWHEKFYSIKLFNFEIVSHGK
jgi:hypothetical protein